MKFLLTSEGMRQIPEFIEKTGNNLILNWIHLAGMWLAHSGLPLVAEGLLCWALFCFLMAITGRGKWMERGVKTLIGFVMLGVAAHAV